MLKQITMPMPKVDLTKCPKCGGDLKNTKIKIIGDHKEFVCRNCMSPLGIVK